MKVTFLGHLRNKRFKRIARLFSKCYDSLNEVLLRWTDTDM